MATYEMAANRELPAVAVVRSRPGTNNALIASYYQTADFTRLRSSTKRTYCNLIGRFRADHGHRLVKEMQRTHVTKIINAKVETPAAANNFLRMVHLLMRHAVEIGWRDDDPTRGVRKIRHRTDGFATWTEAQIDAFIAHHKAGTRAHLAIMLLIHTGQRRGDVVSLGFGNLEDGFLSLRQAKTGNAVQIPVHPELWEILDPLPRDANSFLVRTKGQAFAPASFTNWFRRMDREAGLPDNLRPHGLRKAACVRLADAGCSPHEIMAISGHTSLSEVTRYTVAAGKNNWHREQWQRYKRRWN
nr:tyrosine-type recombinase/integrase [Paracoccus saliphilus]